MKTIRLTAYLKSILKSLACLGSVILFICFYWLISMKENKESGYVIGSLICYFGLCRAVGELVFLLIIHPI